MWRALPHIMWICPSRLVVLQAFDPNEQYLHDRGPCELTLPCGRFAGLEKLIPTQGFSTTEYDGNTRYPMVKHYWIWRTKQQAAEIITNEDKKRLKLQARAPPTLPLPRATRTSAPPLLVPCSHKKHLGPAASCTVLSQEVPQAAGACLPSPRPLTRLSRRFCTALSPHAHAAGQEREPDAGGGGRRSGQQRWGG